MYVILKKKRKRRLIRFLLFLVIMISFGAAALQCYAIRQNRVEQYAIIGPNGIHEQFYLEIGGIDQAVLIRGSDQSNPIVLDLHGGPGYSNIPFAYQPDWEEYFTMVYFDQRMAGKTYLANDYTYMEQTDSMDRRVQDVLDIAQYLTERFGQEKIILHGSSWGTVLGIHAIEAEPSLFSAYVANSQLVNQYRADSYLYQETLRLAREQENRKDITRLERLEGRFPTRVYTNDFYPCLSTLRKTASAYVGQIPLTSNGGGVGEGFLPQLYSPYCSVPEALLYLGDINSPSKAAASYMVEQFDLAQRPLEFEVPLYFIYGEKDYITPPFLLEQCYDQIKAPDKQLWILPQAGHGSGGKSAYLELLLNNLQKQQEPLPTNGVAEVPVV